MAAAPLGKTLATETKAMLSQTWANLSKEMVKKEGTAAALKAFAGNFGFKALLEGAANDTFQSEVMQPVLQAAENRGKVQAKRAQAPAAKDAKAAPGFSVKAAASPKAAEPKDKPAPAKQAKAKPAEPKEKPRKKKFKRRPETPEERRARRKALLEKAKKY